MKTLLFIFSIFIFSFSFGQIVNQNIPGTLGSASSFRAPNGTSAHTTIRAHYMIYPSDLTALPSGAKIISAGFIYLNGVDTAATGNLKFYLENSTTTSNTKSTTWATAITGMDSLYDGAYSIPVSATGTTSSFVLSDTFTYTGSGIQVAYDYLGSTFATTAATYDCNSSVTSDLKMGQSATTTPLAILNASSSWRPGLYISYVNPFTNDISVEFIVLGEGHHNKINDTTQSIIGTIKNKSIGTLTSVPVTLTITGANPSVTSQTVASIAAGASDTLTFIGLSAANSGMQTVKLSVPSDQFTANDSIQLVQSVSCDSLSYLDNSVQYTAIGFNTGGGILAAKHKGSSLINTSIKAIYTNIDINTVIAGNQLQAVLLDTGGTIIDSSAIITITTGQLGSTVVFPLTGNNIILPLNPDYFIGIRQYPNTVVGYFPMTSHSPASVPADRYYSFDMDGSNQSTSYTTLGTLGLGALIEVERLALTNSDANDSICSGELVTFTATGSSALYNFKNGVTSLQNTASTSYMTNLSSTTTINVEGMHNTCPVFSNSSLITVITINNTVSKTDDSTAVAGTTWATFQWIDCGTGLPVVGETARSYTTDSSGFYKVAITIAGCSDTSNCVQLIVPYASINEKSIKSLNVYPSPANTVLTVENDYSLIISVSIMEINGKVISSHFPKNSKTTLDVSILPSGVYLLNVVSGNGTEVKRFIKQ
ncbi:T9SS type A sorting domain-containing protein [Flavobacteriales bacterium]|nr:T9SS type A sorting domain-containing protein [Flavobacteriales bacterium]MDB4088649.1 T9SS type A sorting domain-containing protein [Flavobacteriales bacterium]